MNYLRLPWMEDAVSVFDICQAHRQLESDYNVGGWLRERTSNQRRMESTGVQLERMRYRAPYWWVDIYVDRDFDDEDEDVRDIYILNVLKLNLPIEPDERKFIRRRYADEFLQQFPNMKEAQA